MGRSDDYCFTSRLRDAFTPEPLKPRKAGVGTVTEAVALAVAGVKTSGIMIGGCGCRGRGGGGGAETVVVVVAGVTLASRMAGGAGIMSEVFGSVVEVLGPLREALGRSLADTLGRSLVLGILERPKEAERSLDGFTMIESGEDESPLSGG